MLALVGAVSSLLLIACANVSNLMLVRSSVRQRDLAVRAALGGSWWRLVRQMLAEAVLLSLLGAPAAIGLAPLLIRVLLALAPQNLPRLESIAVDWRVPLFAAAAGWASAVIFGIVVALRAARPDVMHILRGEGHPASSASGQLLRNTVVIVEARFPSYYWSDPV
jgi:putative ABC transport system permease protein